MVWRRRGRPLFSAIYRALAVLWRWPRTMLGGADVLRGARGGHSKVRPPSGFGPHHGGGKAPKAPLTHPRVQTVLRNAVFVIFDHCDLGVVPAQSRPFLTETGDPGE